MRVSDNERKSVKQERKQDEEIEKWEIIIDRESERERKRKRER
jgi:hypothetical protein